MGYGYPHEARALFVRGGIMRKMDSKVNPAIKDAGILRLQSPLATEYGVHSQRLLSRPSMMHSGLTTWWNFSGWNSPSDVMVRFGHF